MTSDPPSPPISSNNDRQPNKVNASVGHQGFLKRFVSWRVGSSAVSEDDEVSAATSSSIQQCHFDSDRGATNVAESEVVKAPSAFPATDAALRLWLWLENQRSQRLRQRQTSASEGSDNRHGRPRFVRSASELVRSTTSPRFSSCNEFTFGIFEDDDGGSGRRKP
jgi:hypothetical protein